MIILDSRLLPLSTNPKSPSPPRSAAIKLSTVTHFKERRLPEPQWLITSSSLLSLETHFKERTRDLLLSGQVALDTMGS